MTGMPAAIPDSWRLTVTSSFSMRTLFRVMTCVAFVGVNANPLFAQQTASVDDQRVTFAGGIDVRNVYMFRGVRQDDSGTIA